MKRIETVYHQTPTHDGYSYWRKRKQQKDATDRRLALARKLRVQQQIRRKEAELELRRLFDV